MRVEITVTHRNSLLHLVLLKGEGLAVSVLEEGAASGQLLSLYLVALLLLLDHCVSGYLDLRRLRHSFVGELPHLDVKWAGLVAQGAPTDLRSGSRPLFLALSLEVLTHDLVLGLDLRLEGKDVLTNVR